MSFEELSDGVVIKMMSSVNHFNQLVVTDRDDTENGSTTKRVKPIIWFGSGKWKHIPQKVIQDFKPFGYYLVSIPWTIRSPQIIDGQRVNGGECHVLHCVRKEHPFPKFGGKVGPMSSFAPRVNDRGILIRGYYVGYHWNGKESMEEIPNHFSGKLTLKGRKPIDSKKNISECVRRLGVIVGKDGYCVGMEVRLSKEEERKQRKKGEYHHNRPIILGNGFYVFDGVFKWQPIHSTLEKPTALPTDITSPLIFLGEGIHLITSTKSTGSSNGETYQRNVEICPSIESEHVSIVDWDVFAKDFLS